MMMSKPKKAEEETASSQKKVVVPASPFDAVADLERRLADLSSATPHIAPIEDTVVAQPPAFATPPSAAAAATTAASNKNALLVRDHKSDTGPRAMWNVCLFFVKVHPT